jgi:lysozyme
MARVSDGFYHDPEFQRNWGEAKAHGVIRGTYQFFRPTRDAIQQADDFLAQFSMSTGDIPPMLDVEVTDGAGSGQIVNGINAWCAHVQKPGDV